MFRGHQRFEAIGNVTADPKIHAVKEKEGEIVAAFDIAVNRYWKDKDGKDEEAVEFIPLRTFGGLAKMVEKYVKKGKQVFVEGEIRNTKFTDKDGIERYGYQVHVNSLELGSDPRGSEQ